MDKSGASKTAIDAINTRRDVPIVVRQVKSGEMRPLI